jgi:transcriptional regulator with XRE-family HTH domain
MTYTTASVANYGTIAMSETLQSKGLALLGAGVPHAQIASQLGVNIRTVFKWQARQRATETVEKILDLAEVPTTDEAILAALRASLGRTVAKLAANPNAGDLLKAAKACQLIAQRGTVDERAPDDDMAAITALRQRLADQLTGIEAGLLGLSFEEYEAEILAQAEEKRRLWREANAGTAH